MSISKNKIKDFGSNLRIVRTTRNMKQYELANVVGVTPHYISLIETGRKKPSLRTASKLAEALDVDTSTLIGEHQVIHDLELLTQKYSLSTIIEGLATLTSMTSKSGKPC